MSHYRPGRHELGQNHLTDHRVITRVVELVSERPGPIVEWGTGDGALTVPLAALRRSLLGLDIDPRRAHHLQRRLGPHVCISEGDILRHAPPQGAVVVGNIPFHITTAILRHLLASPTWENAVLITQWEVARKRTGVGGATQLTAQSWPWFEFVLDRRIPAEAFRPRPSVDAGLFTIQRREHPLVSSAERARYESWVARVFTGRGRGLADILTRNGVPPALASDLARSVGSRRTPLPRDMDAGAWVTAYLAAAPPSGRGGRRRRRARR